jgi:hypothetical protein
MTGFKGTEVPLLAAPSVSQLQAVAASCSVQVSNIAALQNVKQSQIQWSDADKDVGVAALPVTWKV